MLLIFCLQVCFVLVSSNPLYDVNFCPTTTYPNYGNAEQLLIQTGNNNPYLQNLLLYNQLTPNIPSKTILPQQLTNLLVPNQQFYFQNGFDVTKQVSQPLETHKVLNNYVSFPEEYYTNNENRNRKGTTKNESNFKTNNKKKRQRQLQKTSPDIYKEKENVNNRKTISELKPEKLSESENEKSKNKRRKSRKKRKRNKTKPTITEAIIEKKESDNGENLKLAKKDKIILDDSDDNRHIPIRNKCEPETSKGLTSESKPKKDASGFDDVHVCFDINEDCTDLDCRHTRNKDVNTRNSKSQPKPQQNPPNNFMNLINTFGSNQQMSPNFFNPNMPNMNYPFNFDYLYQNPQPATVKSRESGSRRRNRKRKQQSNRQTNSNRKVKESKATTESCDKVVELVPETPEIEITTMATVTTTIIEEINTTPVVETTENVIQDETLLESFKSNTEKPITIEVESVSELNRSDGNIMLFDNYNDILDEYYPDFTSDKSYLESKEDYEFNNFHDRHYYAYGDDTELSRDRRRYEHQGYNELNNNRIINTNEEIKGIDTSDHNRNNYISTTPQSSETYIEKEQILFPSPLEFPGFRTEIINKEEYFAKEKNYGNDVFSKNKMSYSDLKEHMEANEHYNNNVETVFANSKVVKYGTSEKKATTNLPSPVCKKEQRKNIADDNKTVIIIAKSLDI